MKSTLAKFFSPMWLAIKKNVLVIALILALGILGVVIGIPASLGAVFIATGISGNETATNQNVEASVSANAGIGLAILAAGLCAVVYWLGRTRSESTSYAQSDADSREDRIMRTIGLYFLLSALCFTMFALLSPYIPQVRDSHHWWSNVIKYGATIFLLMGGILLAITSLYGLILTIYRIVKQASDVPHNQRKDRVRSSLMPRWCSQAKRLVRRQPQMTSRSEDERLYVRGSPSQVGKLSTDGKLARQTSSEVVNETVECGDCSTVLLAGDAKCPSCGSTKKHYTVVAKAVVPLHAQNTGKHKAVVGDSGWTIIMGLFGIICAIVFPTMLTLSPLLQWANILISLGLIILLGLLILKYRYELIVALRRLRNRMPAEKRF